MKPKLKEDPREWRNFTGVVGLAAIILAGMLVWKNKLPISGLVCIAGIGLSVFLIACARPRWFRGFYRVGMTGFHYLGQFIGKILLTVFYFLVVTPLGLLMRVTGKDLLHLRKRGSQASYWVPAKNTNRLDRMF